VTEFKDGDRVTGRATVPRYAGELVTGELLAKGQRHEEVDERSIHTDGDEERYVDESSLFPPPTSLFLTKSSGARASFDGGGVRDTETGKPRFDLLRPVTVPHSHQMLTRWAALMARGAEKYAARNWEQFSDPAALDRAKSSAARHFEQWFNGETDEDHAAAVLFNVTAGEYVKGVIGGLWTPLEAA
jgi:Domain of unknown function (DUF5664)